MANKFPMELKLINSTIIPNKLDILNNLPDLKPEMKHVELAQAHINFLASLFTTYKP